MAEETKIVADGDSVRVETPKGSKHKPNISVIVGGDEVVGGFLSFLREHAIVGLAIGLVIGTQVKSVVDAIVNSFINPLFTLVFGGQALSKRTFTLSFSGRHADFGWGAVTYVLIDFIFIMFAIYVLVKMFKLEEQTTKKKKK